MADQPIRCAVLSVSDKTGIVELARELSGMGVKLISTGGTQRALTGAGIAVQGIEEFTGFPEMLGGRVKTLHPKVFAGLLARRDVPGDVKTLADHGFLEIDMVVVNLYPFSATIARPGATWEEAVENIDIGGPSLLRAAAKNHSDVTAICNPADYPDVIQEMKKNGGTTTLSTRRRLARKVFAHTSQYDATIAGYFLEKERTGFSVAPSAAPTEAAPVALPTAAPTEAAPASALFPPVFTIAWPKAQDLRYGENPHQHAAFYVDPGIEETSLALSWQLHGKELSYNNILDAEGALEMIRDFDDLAPAAAVIVKHSNPCGIALGETLAEAYTSARSCDPEAAYGGIVTLSRPMDFAAAQVVSETFLEVILAPDYSPEALELLRKKKNLRLLSVGAFTPKKPRALARGIVGGLLVMDRDLGGVKASDLKVVTKTQPEHQDVAGLLFAWRCVKWVKSNAIVYTNHRATLGIGAGQMSRADSARLGVVKARQSLTGCYMASDAFFPFRDSIDEAAKVGVRAVIQPGGSIRDAEVIQAADEHGIIMAFTGMRHFRH